MPGELRYEFSEQGLDACLSDLGDTPEEIAAKLAELGFRGVRSQSHACPVARYVTAALGAQICDVQIETDDSLYVRASAGEAMVDTFASDDMGSFVVRFDMGDYPDLIDGGPTRAA